jgi:DNA-binding NarL/FixJ family response regulator
VLVIDRHALVVAALSRLLSGAPLNAEVIACTQSGDVVANLDQNPVDVVVCEVEAQPISGPELTAMLASRYPALKVVLLVDRDSEPLLPAALLSGAQGFFMKESPAEEFVAGVTTVLLGQCVIGSSLLQRALSLLANRGQDKQGRLGQLSPAELGILALLGETQTVRGIAQARGISPKTVRNHLATVYRKLKVRNRAEATLWAARMGVVRLGNR